MTVIDSDVELCPHCGRPWNKHGRHGSLYLWVVVLAALAGALGIWVGGWVASP